MYIVPSVCGLPCWQITVPRWMRFNFASSANDLHGRKPPVSHVAHCGLYAACQGCSGLCAAVETKRLHGRRCRLPHNAERRASAPAGGAQEVLERPVAKHVELLQRLHLRAQRAKPTDQSSRRRCCERGSRRADTPTRPQIESSRSHVQLRAFKQEPRAPPARGGSGPTAACEAPNVCAAQRGGASGAHQP